MLNPFSHRGMARHDRMPYYPAGFVPWPMVSDVDGTLKQMMDFLHHDPDDSSSHPRQTEPSYSYRSNDKAAYVEVELPGVAKDDISIEVNGDRLVVTGNRFSVKMEEESQKDAKGKKKEEDPKPSTVYKKTFQMDRRADVKAIKADHQGDGILRLTIPNKVEGEPEVIKIGL